MTASFAKIDTDAARLGGTASYAFTRSVNDKVADAEDAARGMTGDFNENAIAALVSLLAYSRDAKVIAWFADRGVTA